MKNKFSKLGRAEMVANFPSEKSDVVLRNNLTKFNLLYSGGIGDARGLFNMLDVITELVNIDERYTLTLAGSIEQKDLKKAKNHIGWKYTNYLGVLTKDEVYNQYKLNSLGLILFNNVGQYHMSYALKLFEYMQCGLIVIMPDFGDWVEFNRDFKVGYNVDTNDSRNIAKLISNLSVEELESISLHNQELANVHFIWDLQASILIDSYGDIS